MVPRCATTMPDAGCRIWLLATTGAENVPSLGDFVPAGSDAAEIVSFHKSVLRRCNVRSLGSMNALHTESTVPWIPCMEVVVFNAVCIGLG